MSIIARSYLPNLDKWLLRSPAQETLQAISGAVQRQTFYAYDGQAEGTAPTAGKVTQVRQGLGSVWTTTQMQYDAWGNPEVVTDALGHATHTAYDPVSRQFPVRVTNALGHVAQTQWDVRLGVPHIITDANGATTHLAYDSFGRVTAVTPPGDAFPAVQYTYPSGDAVAAPFAVHAETRVDAYTPTPQYQAFWTFYDGLGRVLQTQTQAADGLLVLHSTAYDALGRPVTATLPYTVPATGGNYYAPDWNVIPHSLTSYDVLGRVTRVQAADGSLTRQRYRAWRTLLLDAEGRQTIHVHDGLGRLREVREFYDVYSAPDWDAANPAVTRYSYAAAGNLTRVQDALGHLTRIAYDPLGRKVWMADPSMGEWSYTYDAAGNLTSQTDAERQTLTFHYDELHRLTHKFESAKGESANGEWENGEWVNGGVLLPPYSLLHTAYSLLAEYGYDEGPNGIGRRTAMTDTSGVTTWQYDTQGRVLNETKTIAGAGTFVSAWGYDAAGRIIETTGESVQTLYNLRGLPTRVAGANVYLSHAAYNAAGQPVRQTWGNTLQTTYAYEPDTLRLERLQVSGGLLDLVYTYDQVGNIKRITDAANAGQTQTFTYDARDRLLTAYTSAVGEGRYSESYTYDRMGNLLTRTVDGELRAYTYGRPPEPSAPVTSTLPQHIYLPFVARAYDPSVSTVKQPFAVVAVSDGFHAAYDLNGNMTLRVEVSGTERITYTQAWNAENRLAVVTNTVSGEVTRFVYDGNGQRVLREDADGVTVYVGAIEVRISATERVTTSYYFVGSQRVAMRRDGELTYLHGDHLGSASLATDASGVKISDLRYRPFGETRYGDAPTDRRFTGQREESSLGLYDYNARFYSAGLGRFVSADSIVPGTASGFGGGAATLGYDRQTRLTPLTVHLSEFVAQVNEENREVLQFGAFSQWDSRTRQQYNVPMGPLNPQALNRYAYCLNNPLRYTDPTGHEWVVIGEHQYTLAQLRELSRTMYNMSNALAVAAAVEGLAGATFAALLSPIPPIGVAAIIVIEVTAAVNAIEAVQTGALHSYLESVIAEAEKRGYDESDIITLTLSDVRKEGFFYNAAVCLSSDLTPNEGIYTFLITASALRAAFSKRGAL